jgi:Holliday junction DNA helicase RuvA
MIEYLAGTLASKEPTRAVIETQGIGYEVFISLQTFDTLPDTGAPVKLFTYLYVREDAMLLYGFASQAERSAFRLLLGVSGVGAKVAMAVLSGASVDELEGHITSGRVGALQSIPGIGKKTAERIVVELRDKLGKAILHGETVISAPGDVRTEAVLALVALGYSTQNAENGVRKAISRGEFEKNDVGALIKSALRALSG